MSKAHFRFLREAASLLFQKEVKTEWKLAVVATTPNLTGVSLIAAT